MRDEKIGQRPAKDYVELAEAAVAASGYIQDPVSDALIQEEVDLALESFED